MKIEITNLDTKELVKILRVFPEGKILVENNKAYWESISQLPQQQPIQNHQTTRRSGDFFTNMRNSLFEAFGA